MSLLFGLVGVLVGAGIASGYNYWSIRRSELEEALVSATIMHDEIQTLMMAMGRSPAAASAQLVRAASNWDERRPGLVVFLAGGDFQEVGEVIRDARSVLSSGALGTQPPQDDGLNKRLGRLVAEFDAQMRELRRQHQAFIATPLTGYFRGLAQRALRKGRPSRHLSPAEDHRTELQ